MTTTVTPTANPTEHRPTPRFSDRPPPLLGRFFGVIAKPQSYRNIAYLLLGLPMGTLWFCALITGVAIGISTLLLALVGVPLLIGCWYLTRSIANIERVAANALLGQQLAPVAFDAPSVNLWQRLRAMSTDGARWRELGYILSRFPVGIATFTAAVALISTSASIAYAPFYARYDDDRSFGDWTMSSRLEDISSSSPWSWLLLSLGALAMIASFHLMNRLADACGRWTAASLGSSTGDASPMRAQTAPPARAVASRAALGHSTLLRIHTLVFAAVMSALTLIDLADGGTLWIRWPIITWGGVLGFHAATVRNNAGGMQSQGRVILRIHRAAFGAVITMLVLIDLVGGGAVWFYWPLAIWGTLLLLHEAAVRSFNRIISS